MDTNNDIHKMASLVNFPVHRYKSVKAIILKMIEQIPILTKYMSFVNMSKDTNPLCYVSKPKVVTDTAFLEKIIIKGKQKNEAKIGETTSIMNNKT